MRGVRSLVEMRRAGHKPQVAFIDCDANPHGMPAWAQWQQQNPDMADIDMEPGDSLARIDWRPFVGMVVHVSGTDERRVRTTKDRLAEAGAKRVIYTLLEQIGRDEWIAFKTVWVYDTEGQFAPREAG
jgi:hypothetical protein